MKRARKRNIARTDEGALDVLHQPALPTTHVGPDDWVEQIRRRRAWQVRRLLLQVAAFVLLPTLMAAVYYLVIATPRYVSQAQLTVHGASTSSAAGLGSLFGSVIASAEAPHLLVVEEYIRSPALLRTLDQWLDLRGHYAQPDADYLSRLAPDASEEDFHEYFLSRIKLWSDSARQVMTLQVQAFDPNFAKAAAQAIVILSEDLINSMSDKIREDMLSGARRELERSEEKLRTTRIAVMEFRIRNKDFDPRQSAGVLEGISGTLEAQLVAARAELAQAGSYMRANSAPVAALKAKVKALEEQLVDARERLVGQAGQQALPYTTTLLEYETLRIDEEFAKTMHQTALTALETARAEADRKHAYLLDFVSPTLPDAATEPDAFLGVLTTFVVALLLLLISRFVMAALREHMQG